MGYLQKVTDKSALEGLPPAFECTIRVEPYLEEPDYDAPNEHDIPIYTCMGVRFSCGKDEPRTRNLFIHQGAREGAEWEKSKILLRVLLRYIQDHIGNMMIEGTAHLSDEAHYVGIPGKRLKEIFDKSQTIAQLLKHWGTAYKAGEKYETEIDMWVYDFVAHMKNRLEGFAHIKIGDDTILRFSRFDMKLFMETLPECQRIWQRARKILKKDPEKGKTDAWKEIVKSEFDIKPYNDDLLDAIAKWNAGRRDYEYKPSQVALVHAARRATVNTREKHFSQPTADQYKTVERLKKEWEKRTAEAEELGFRLDTFWWDKT